MSNVFAHHSTAQPLVGALRQLMQSRKDEEQAKRRFWRRLALGSLIFVVCGVIAAFIYYLHGHEGELSGQSQFANALKEAFEGKPLTIKPTGEVKIAPSEVELAPGQTVSLDKGASAVKSSRPVHQEKPDPAAPDKRRQKAEKDLDQTVYDFVVFKNIPFLNGKIETAWNYVNSNQEAPTSQNCKFRKSIDVGHDEYVLLAVDGYPRVNPKTVDFDVYDALKSCVWFGK